MKISFSAMIAIGIAELMALNFTVSAGIVAILTVAPTKKETFKTATNRLYAFVVALVLAFVCLPLFQFHLLGFYLYLIIFILICQWKNWASAMAMNSVLISHFLSVGNMNLEAVMNEILLFIIGTGCGIFVNLFLRENRDYMEKMVDEIDTQIKTILTRMSQRILEGDFEDYNGECFKKIKISVDKARSIAEENFLNQMKKKKSRDIQYISMREQQIYILYNIYKRIRKLKTTAITAQEISDFFLFLVEKYNHEQGISMALEKFRSIQIKLEDTPLPQTRLEFEERAELYVVLGNMKEFILLREEFQRNL